MVYQFEVLAHDVDINLRDQWKVYFQGKPEVSEREKRNISEAYAFGYLRGKYPSVIDWIREKAWKKNGVEVFFESEDDRSVRATIWRMVVKTDDQSSLPVSDKWSIYEDGDLRQRGIV